MSDYVIVRINEKLIPEFQINYNANTKIANSRPVSVWSDIVLEHKEKLILIISASIVLTQKIKIPSKNEEIIRQSIPYALEELLANDIDDNHFAYRQMSEQNFLVSVIQTSAMEVIQKELKNNGLDCQQMVSEIFAVPYHLGKISIISLNNYHIIREEYTGTTVRTSMLKAYIASSRIDKQILYAQPELDTSEFPNAEIKKIDTTLLHAMTVTSQDSVNLLQAQFSQKDDKAQTKKPLRKMLILMVMLMVSWLAINIYSLWDISADINELKDRQEKLLLELIPNASETEKRDPYSAILSRLKISQNNKPTNGKGGFIQSLHYIGQTLLDHPTIQVQSLRQRNSKLEVSVRTTDMSKLNAFQSSLEKNVWAMRVKTGTREVSNNGVSSVITMEAMQ
ncbi:MAG: type II secretion system protein GspL [Proteobacteria bacterium]|nr:type II secretion system protein GspL [Pseudomonadota bacterium]